MFDECLALVYMRTIPCSNVRARASGENSTRHEDTALPYTICHIVNAQKTRYHDKYFDTQQ